MNEHLLRAHQGDWPEPTKFDQLRIKTDRQLYRIVTTELDLAIRDGRHALKSADTWAVAEACYRRANRAHAEVVRLIPLIVEMTNDERSRVESKVERLKRMLAAVSAIGSTPTPAENEIAAFARAVWEAKGCPNGLPEEDWFRAERALKVQRESNVVCA
jgi:hypothetical protein